METSVFSSDCFSFLKEDELLARIERLRITKHVDIRVRKIVGDTVYVEVKNAALEIRNGSYELLELAYNLMMDYLPSGYRLAIEI